MNLLEKIQKLTKDRDLGVKGADIALKAALAKLRSSNPFRLKVPQVVSRPLSSEALDD
jgi:hypothetical protein